MNNVDEVSPILGVGSPRSGTTLIGEYIGSHPDVLYLGEYAGYYFAYHLTEWAYRRLPFKYKDRFLDEIKDQVEAFPCKTALQENMSWYYDSAPLNALVIDRILASSKRALFVVAIRHYTGVIQSLSRSYEEGYEWAGSTWADRAAVWSDFYSNIVGLPPERTLVFSYDKLCSNPGVAIRELNEGLCACGIDAEQLDVAVFEDSHATSEAFNRPTLRFRTGDSKARFRSIPSFDPDAWTEEIASQVEAVVEETDHAMRQRFPEAYVDPRTWPR